MSFTPAWSPPPSRRLPLGLAMALAVLFHLFLIALFMHAHVPLQAPLPVQLPILQIDLTPRSDEPPPKRPDGVAEANQRAEETGAPKTSTPPKPVPSTMEEVPLPPSPKTTPVRPKAVQDKVDTPESPRLRSTKPTHRQEAPGYGKVQTLPLPTPKPPAAPELSLAERSLQMNRLRAEILEQSLREERAARSTVLTANTTYGPEAAYLRAWVEKVERIGNLNFPDEARRKRLSGRLILQVILDNQGRVISMRVRQSSGEPVLDKAAQDIVRLASPFAPFPPDLRMKYDQLTIIRTWVFDAGSRLDTR